jgi:hypothetical protein
VYIGDLKEQLEEAVEEEEGELFPKVEKDFPEKELAALGDEMQVLSEQLCQETPRSNVPGETASAAPLTEGSCITARAGNWAGRVHAAHFEYT